MSSSFFFRLVLCSAATPASYSGNSPRYRVTTIVRVSFPRPTLFIVFFPSISRVALTTTLQIPAPLCVLQGRRFKLVPSESRLLARIPKDFRYVLKRHSCWLTFERLLCLSMTVNQWPSLFEFLCSHCCRCDKIEELFTPVYSTANKRDKRVCHRTSKM